MDPLTLLILGILFFTVLYSMNRQKDKYIVSDGKDKPLVVAGTPKSIDIDLSIKPPVKLSGSMDNTLGGSMAAPAVRHVSPRVLPGYFAGCLGGKESKKTTDNLRTNEDINREDIQNPLTIEKNGVVYCGFSAISNCGILKNKRYTAVQNYDESYDILKNGKFQKRIVAPDQTPKAVSLSDSGDFNFYYR